MKGIPSIAIINPDTLAVLGLKHLLGEVMPDIEICTFNSFAELSANHPERFFHYFASMHVVLANMPFFLANAHKTIVLTLALTDDMSLANFHTLCTTLPEKQLLRALLMLEQHAHANGRNLPPATHAAAMHGNAVARHTEAGKHPVLSAREIEVISLVARGHKNKEIADMLHLSLLTIVTHRKNIMNKLALRSVSALTIYAVMHGYVDVNDI